MTKFDSLREDFTKTVKNLEEILQKEKTDETRDSAIKRFELCFDVAWKLLKVMLEDMGVKCYSPFECFKEAYQKKIIDSYDDFWVGITKTRNEAVHTYKEELAEDLYKKLPEILKHFKILEKNIKK